MGGRVNVCVSVIHRKARFERPVKYMHAENVEVLKLLRRFENLESSFFGGQGELRERDACS